MIKGIFNDNPSNNYGNIHTLEKIPKDFEISRPEGIFCYTILFFQEPVLLWCQDGLVKTKPHAVILYFPFEKQYYKTITPTAHSWMHFDDASGEVCKRCGLKSSYIYYPKSDTKLIKQFSQIQYEMLCQKGNHEIMIDALINVLFVTLARQLNIETNAPKNNLTIPKEYFLLRQTIINNLEKKWVIQDMAASLGISIPSFHLCYRKFFGISPIDELIHLRIEKAKFLLRETTQSVHEIAEQSGYANIYHFSRQFKKYVGMSPADYRKTPNS